MTLSPVSVSYVDGNGQLVRWLRGGGGGTTATVPGAPTAVSASNITSTAATLRFGLPASNGGSPITGWLVSRDGPSPWSATIPATATSQAFLSLLPATAYNLSVAAVNATGTGPARTVAITTPDDQSTVAGRFPGDPGKNSRTLYYGQSKTANGAVGYQETAAGVRLGCHRTYFSTLSDIAPGGPLTQMVKADHAANRFPFVSFRLTETTAAAGGNDSQMDALIADLEALPKPVAVAINHEPENDGINPLDWRGMQVRFRQRLTAYRNANPAQPRRIAFYSCLMTQTWVASSGRNPADWWCGTGVHDIVAGDHYSGPNTTVVRPQLTTFIDWCTGHGVPFAVTEWALANTDVDAVAKMQVFYDAMTDGTKDCVAAMWWDATQGGPGQWQLTDANGDLTKHRQLMADPRSIHLSDLGF